MINHYKLNLIYLIKTEAIRQQADKINKIGLWGHYRVTKVELKKVRFLIPVNTGLFISMFITFTHTFHYRAFFLMR